MDSACPLGIFKLFLTEQRCIGDLSRCVSDCTVPWKNKPTNEEEY